MTDRKTIPSRIMMETGYGRGCEPIRPDERERKKYNQPDLPGCPLNRESMDSW